MSKADSSLGWDLRCEVREKLLDFIQRKHPDVLPKTRLELQKNNGPRIEILKEEYVMDDSHNAYSVPRVFDI
jgi:hypothetical protein